MDPTTLIFATFALVFNFTVLLSGIVPKCGVVVRMLE